MLKLPKVGLQQLYCSGFMVWRQRQKFAPQISPRILAFLVKLFNGILTSAYHASELFNVLTSTFASHGVDCFLPFLSTS